MLDLRSTLAAITKIAATAAMAAALVFAGAPVAAADVDADHTEGEVRKVDKDTRKLTIRHGPIRNLDMPGMTMVFVVRDEAVLDKLRVGDKVRFQAEKIDGKLTVTNIEPAQ